MKWSWSIIVVLGITSPVLSQNTTENIVIVTLDGMRWQEVFGGADSVLLYNKNYTKDSSGTFGKFWDHDANARRKKLFPFLWNTVVTKGQLYGNRWLGNKVDNANRYWFSYPGYNELFTGKRVTTIRWRFSAHGMHFLIF